jgi:hypothetical protein
MANVDEHAAPGGPMQTGQAPRLAASPQITPATHWGRARRAAAG